MSNSIDIKQHIVDLLKIQLAVVVNGLFCLIMRKFGASDMCLKFLWILSLKVGLNILENFNVLSSCEFQCYLLVKWI